MLSRDLTTQVLGARTVLVLCVALVTDAAIAAPPALQSIADPGLTRMGSSRGRVGRC